MTAGSVEVDAMGPSSASGASSSIVLREVTSNPESLVSVLLSEAGAGVGGIMGAVEMDALDSSNVSSESTESRVTSKSTDSNVTS